MQPDLVIHVGDYHYREGPCDLAHLGLLRQSLGLRLRCLARGSLPPGAQAPRSGAVDRHPRQSRIVQPRRAGMVALPRSAAASCREGTAMSRPTTTSATTARRTRCRSAADRTLQFLVFDSSWVGTDAAPPAVSCTGITARSSRRAFALGARTPRAFFISHHPMLGFASNPNDPQNPFPGNGGLHSVLTPMYRHGALSAQRRRRAVGAQSPARDRELLVTASAAVHHRQRRRLGRPAVSRAVSRWHKQPAPGAVIAQFAVDAHASAS